MGSTYLQQTLNQQLVEHIRQVLPNLEDELKDRMVWMEEDVREFQNLKLDYSDIDIMKSKMQTRMQRYDNYLDDHKDTLHIHIPFYFIE